MRHCSTCSVDRLVHLKQAGAMAAFAEQLEQEGEPRAAVMADQLAEFYRQWAEDPGVVPPEIEAPPERAAAVADLRARVEAVAEELEVDSRDAMKRADAARARGQETGARELYTANVRHARVAHQAASAIRGAVTDTTGGTQ